MNLRKLWEIVEDRGAWLAAVRGVAMNQTWFSDWTTTVQSLLNLFQTSEKSEFLGYTDYTENNGICDVLDIWEEGNSNNLLSLFFSSLSTSIFSGF